jgi:hypothetical protein
MWGLLLLVVIFALFVAYDRYIKPSSSDVPSVYLHNQFIDLDGNGWPDYLIYGEAVMNCKGGPCKPLAPAAGGASDFFPDVVLPTPEVFQQGGGDPSSNDPDVGGGGPSTPADTQAEAVVPDPN